MSSLNIFVASDLHLESRSVSDKIDLSSSLRETAKFCDFSLFAGDIDRGYCASKWIDVISPYRPSFCIMGNGEYYSHRAMSKTCLDWRWQAAILNTRRSGLSPILPLECDVGYCFIKDIHVRVLGATLWTPFLFLNGEEDHETFSIAHDKYMKSGMIFDDPLNTKTLVDLYERSLLFLERELLKPWSGPTIIMTHHVPDIRSLDFKFRSHPRVSEILSRTDRLMKNSRWCLWVHGHTHNKCAWYSESGGLVVCNPIGRDGELTLDQNPMVVSLIQENLSFRAEVNFATGLRY